MIVGAVLLKIEDSSRSQPASPTCSDGTAPTCEEGSATTMMGEYWPFYLLRFLTGQSSMWILTNRLELNAKYYSVNLLLNKTFSGTYFTGLLNIVILSSNLIIFVFSSEFLSFFLS